MLGKLLGKNKLKRNDLDEKVKQFENILSPKESPELNDILINTQKIVKDISNKGKDKYFADFKQVYVEELNKKGTADLNKVPSEGDKEAIIAY